MISDLLYRRSETLEQLFKRGLFDTFVTRDGKKNEKQRQALVKLVDKETKEFGYGGAAGGAKSWTGCLWLAMACKIYPNTKWFIGRVELKRLRETTLITFFKVCREYSIKGWKYNGQDHKIVFENGSIIDLLELEYKPSDPMFERYGSAEYTGGWIEEAGEVHFGAFDTLRSRVNRHMNDDYGLTAKIFITLNPKKNWVYEYFWKPYKQDKLPKGVFFLQSFAYDNPFNQEGYIEQLKGIKDPVRRARLLDGDFEYDDNPLAMIDYPKILELYTNEFILPTSTKYLTADIAYEGSDIFVIGIWNGLVLEKIITNDKISEVAVPKLINDHRLAHNIPLGNVIYDADGVKRFVRQSAVGGTLNGAKEFHNNGKPVDAAYFNLKSECYFKLAEYVNANKIFVKDNSYREQVIQELEQMRKVANPDDNKLRVEKKADLKERLGRSPDFMDCFLAGTKILTPFGERNIETLKEGDLVVTPFGNRRVLKTIHRQSNVIHNINDEIYSTPNHRFVNNKGLTSADTIAINDYLCGLSLLNIVTWRLKRLLNTMDRSIGFREQIQNTTMQSQQSGAKGLKSDCTEKYIQIDTGKYPKDSTSTILTGIASITILVTYLRLKKVFIGQHIKSKGLKMKSIKRGFLKTFLNLEKKRQNGIGLKMGESGTPKMQKKHGKIKHLLNVFARFAKKNLKLLFLKWLSFAVTTAYKTIDTKERLDLKKENVVIVGNHLKLEKTRRQKLVQKNVQVNLGEKISVYTLSVEGDNVYYANGYLVENCMAMRMLPELKPSFKPLFSSFK